MTAVGAFPSIPCPEEDGVEFKDQMRLYLANDRFGTCDAPKRLVSAHSSEGVRDYADGDENAEHPGLEGEASHEKWIRIVCHNLKG